MHVPILIIAAAVLALLMLIRNTFRMWSLELHLKETEEELQEAYEELRVVGKEKAEKSRAIFRKKDRFGFPLSMNVARKARYHECANPSVYAKE